MPYLVQQAIKYLKFIFVFRLNKLAYWRSQGCKIGENSEILLSLFGLGSEPWLIEIGNNVTIAPNVTFVTHDASTRLFRHRFSEMNQKFGNSFGCIKVLDNSFIGTNSIILPNAKIGPNAIVGAGSIVTKNVDANTVVAGNPAKVICNLEEYIQKKQKDLSPVQAQNRADLRTELTKRFWKEVR
jgi:acetyltransferase-like isoleucine patch superfamily enzyme